MTLFKNIFGARNRFATYSKGARQVVKTTGEESVNNSTSETTPRLGFRLFVVFWVVATVWGTNRILNWWHGTDLSLLELTALAREATYEPLTHWRQLGLGLSVVAGLYYAFYSGSTSKTLWLDALVFGFVRVVVYYTFLTWFRVDGLDLEPLWTTRLTDRFRFLLGADPTTTTWRVIRDSLSLVFILLTHFLLIICIYLMVPTFGVDPKAGLGVLRLAVLWAQLVMTFMVADLFFFFLVFERLMIPLLFLIGIWGSPNRVQANNYLYFYTTVGAIGMLLAILYLWTTLQTSHIYDLRLMTRLLRWAEQTWLWIGFFLSFAIKTPLVPFHIWLPKAHVEAPTTGSVLLAGLLLKVGLYGVIRICFGLFPEVSAWAGPVVTACAVVGMVYASLVTLRQIDMKRIIAYSSVAHMSLALARIMTGQALGVAAGVYLGLSHGIVSRALFILVGALYARFHNRLVTYYGGLITAMPYFGACFFFFSLANMAFPLTSGFMGEFLCLTALMQQNLLFGVIAASSMLFSTVYSVLLFNRVFLGSLKLQFTTARTTDWRSLDLTANEITILLPCVVLTMYFGIFPSSLLVPYGIVSSL